jgi:hypothetical protein
MSETGILKTRPVGQAGVAASVQVRPLAAEVARFRGGKMAEPK